MTQYHLRHPGLRQVLIVGAILGIVDGVSAVLLNQISPPRGTIISTFQSVAFALLGRATYSLGAASALLGLAMHFTVAMIWAALFVTIYRNGEVIRDAAASRLGWAKLGLPLGAVIWCTMNFVVFPLTRINRHAPIASSNFQINLVHHMIVLGPLIVWATRRFASGQLRPLDGAAIADGGAQ